jgi:hypothetical protein
MTTQTAERRSDQRVRGVSMTLPHKPAMGGEAHADALERLDVAVDDRERLSQSGEAPQGAAETRATVVAVAEADEQVAARGAWLHYIEHGY